MSKNREDPLFWRKQFQGWASHAVPVLDQYVRYTRWFRGEMGDVERRLSGQLPRGARKTLVCLTNLVVRQSRAELFFRAPRFYVRPPGTLNSQVFTPELAHVETLGLNHTVQTVGLYRQCRRMLLDGLLGPFMVGKVGYSADIAIDDDLIDEQRAVADAENQKFLAAGVRMRMKEDDYDPAHIERHDQMISLAERGAIALPKKALDYLRKHRQQHQDRQDKGGGRTTEIVRNDSVFFRRRSPLNVFRDPWHDDLEDFEWVSERFLARLDDVQANKMYSAKARSELGTVSSKWTADSGLPPLPSEALMSPDQYTLLYEVVDLVDKQVLLLGHGCKTPLLVRPYKLADIMPSGPYIFSSFMEDPLEDFGIPPPAVYEAHQIAASYIASINTTAIKRSLPKVLYDANLIRADEIEETKRGQVAALIPLRNMPPGTKAQDAFFQTPIAEVPEQNNVSLAWNQRMCEQLSGLGSAKMAGGDHSRTATASAISSESTSNLSEDNASVVDDMLQTTGRMLVRLKRRFYSKYRMAEEVGEEALDHWPDLWATRDIVNDRGVLLVPGSSRRSNSAVEQKMLEEAYTIVAQDPTADPAFKIEILERLFESLGIYGLDFAGAKQRMEAAQMAAQMDGMTGQGDDQDGDEGGGAAGAPARPSRGPQGGPPRRSESQGTRPDDALQGRSNAGGGRVPTGAGAGDKLRLFRNKKLAAGSRRGRGA